MFCLICHRTKFYQVLFCCKGILCENCQCTCMIKVCYLFDEIPENYNFLWKLSIERLLSKRKCHLSCKGKNLVIFLLL